MEGDSGCVLRSVLSRSTFRRQPLSGQKTFTVLSLHIINVYPGKCGIGKKLNLTIRAVMLRRCDNRNNVSTIETPPPTIVGTRMDCSQLGGRFWVPQTA